MLNWINPRTDLAPGVTVYADDERIDTFYLLPDQPTFRVDDATGLPVVNFIEYRLPIDRPDGKKGGGFLIFDSQFAVDEATTKKIVDALQAELNVKYKDWNPKPKATIGQLDFLRGTAGITCLQKAGGTLVQDIQNPGEPSLYGKLLCPFTVELTPEGAAVVKGAMQDKGPVVQVYYDIVLPVRLPPLTVTVWLDSSKVMSYYQSADTDDGWQFLWWGRDSSRNESSSQHWSQYDFAGVTVDPGTVTDQKVIQAATDWGFQMLDEAAKNVVKDLPGLKDGDTKIPDYDHFRRAITQSSFSSFYRRLTEKQVIEWNPAPRGSLPSIATMKDKDGNPLKFSDFMTVVDADDPFFKQLRVNVIANADFANTPIFSVDAHLEYHSGSTNQVQDFRLAGPDTIGKFASYIENNDWEYTYHYKVNYKGQSRTYASPDITSKDQQLTLNVDSAGYLVVDIVPGDLDFTLVPQAEVTLHYEDGASNVAPIEQEFTLTQANPNAKFASLIFVPRTKPYKYKVTYFMKDGRQVTKDWQDHNGRQLAIDSPFSALKQVHIRPMGDLQTDIAQIFLDLKYADEKNNYQQTASVAINKGNPFFDWTFPVIDASVGKTTYSGKLVYQDNSVEDIAETEITKATVLVGKPSDNVLSVALDPSLLDFSRLKVAKVKLHYEDDGNGLNASKDIVIHKTDNAIPPWTVRIADKTKKSYDYQAEFYMVDGTTKEAKASAVTDTTLLLEVPA